MDDLSTLRTAVGMESSSDEDSPFINITDGFSSVSSFSGLSPSSTAVPPPVIDTLLSPVRYEHIHVPGC